MPFYSVKYLSLALFASSLAGVAIGDSTNANFRPIWGTFRPQALISTRAAVPHSPYFGFVYHSAADKKIRHLATDYADEISLFSWSRHDGRFFGEQEIHDVGLNLKIRSSFQHHPTVQSAWALRLSGDPLDASKPTGPISMVFYGGTGPDDALPDTSSVDDSVFGTLEVKNEVGWGGSSDGVVIVGKAESVGGAFRTIVEEPRYGSLEPTSITIPNEERVLASVGGSGSRSRIRKRSEKPAASSLPVDVFHIASSPADSKEVWNVERGISSMLRQAGVGDSGSDGTSSQSLYILKNSVAPSSSGVFVQRVLDSTFELEVVFVLSENRTAQEVERIEEALSGKKLDELLHHSRQAFDERFDRVFHLREKGVSVGEQEFAKTALSNVLGGIGFFHGSSIAVKKKTASRAGSSDLEFLTPVSLLTATPSRASFPRGFLWDEGFHQLIVQRWDPDLSRKCMLSWMEAIQESGWIPREQILGLEARNRFPEHVQHLMVQNPSVANPPTILMPLRVIASNVGVLSSNETNRETCRGKSDRNDVSGVHLDSTVEFARSILRRVTQYYTWLKITQSGQEENSFRWRGRSMELKAPDGYPLTLASGLDDYPRAERPNLSERHVDLHCWMAWASGALAKLSESAGKDAKIFWEEHNTLRESLFDLHGQDGYQASAREDLLLCDFDGQERLCHEGYPTILPLALGLLDPSDVRIEPILDALEDPSLLKARAGVRSLAKNNRWHRRGDDYWTGSVWMPFNFLTLAALKTKYSVEDGPYKQRARKVFAELQKSVLDNAYKVFSETGQLWENYSPEDDGAGKSGRQFTGWSALVLLMYANMYDGVT